MDKIKRTVPEGPTELVVIHVGLGFPVTPLSGHLVRIEELELALTSLPSDPGGVGLRVGQQLQKKLVGKKNSLVLFPSFPHKKKYVT